MGNGIKSYFMAKTQISGFVLEVQESTKKDHITNQKVIALAEARFELVRDGLTEQSRVIEKFYATFFGKIVSWFNRLFKRDPLSVAKEALNSLNQQPQANFQKRKEPAVLNTEPKISSTVAAPNEFNLDELGGWQMIQ